MTKVKKEVTVRAPLDIVYQAWHNFENFPRFMANIEDVRVVSGGRSHWKAKGPLGSSAEWDAETTLDEPNRAIGWRSIGNSSLSTAGRVNFAEAEGVTHISLTIEYATPGGPLGEAVTKIFSDPERQVEDDLGHFREAIEAGFEQSGFSYGLGGAIANPSGETLGGSLGPVTEQDLEAIAHTNTGITPQETDDPAVRGERGENFGESDTRMPPVARRK